MQETRTFSSVAPRFVGHFEVLCIFGDLQSCLVFVPSCHILFLLPFFGPDRIKSCCILGFCGSIVDTSLNRDAQETRHYVYVDKVGVIGWSVGVVAQRMEEVVESFERQGLQVHEQEAHSGGVKALGVVLDGTTTTCANLMSTILESSRGALGLGASPPIGRAAFFGLVRRENLPVFW